MPTLLLCDWIPGNQPPSRLVFIAGTESVVAVIVSRAADALGVDEPWNVDQARAGVIGRTFPTVGAITTRLQNHGALGMQPVFGFLFGPELASLGINGLEGLDRHIIARRNALTGSHVEHIEVPVFGGLHDNVTLATADLQVRNDEAGGGIALKAIVRNELQMPGVLAGLGIYASRW